MKIWDFLKLYERTDFSGNSFGFFYLLFLAGTVGYVIDMYRLLKRKNGWETVLVMVLPMCLIATVVMVVTLVIYVPFRQGQEPFLEAMEESGLWAEILLTVPVYGLAFGLTWFVRKKQWQNKKERKLWIVSCIPDFVMGVFIVIVGVPRLFFGIDLFRLAGDTTFSHALLYAFLYVLLLFLQKILLLCMCAVMCIYTKKLTFISWKEGRNPERFFAFWGLFCQNAMLRGALSFVLPLAGGLLYASIEDAEGAMRILPVLFMLLICCIVICRIAMTPYIEARAYFAKWGDRRRLMELFCREYFREPPILKGRDYTVTRHFLVDERAALQIWYWEQLKSWNTNWNMDIQGPRKVIRFRDGRECLMKPDEDPADQVIAYAKQYYEGNGMGQISANKN